MLAFSDTRGAMPWPRVVAGHHERRDPQGRVAQIEGSKHIWAGSCFQQDGGRLGKQIHRCHCKQGRPSVGRVVYDFAIVIGVQQAVARVEHVLAAQRWEARNSGWRRY